MGPKQLVAPARIWYRQLLKQARLLAFIWQDPVLYASHRTIGQEIAQKLQNAIDNFEKHERQHTERLREAGRADPALKTDHLGKQVRTMAGEEGQDLIALQRQAKKKLGQAAKKGYPKRGEEEKKLVALRTRADKKLRQLAAANVGWPHAAERALDQAYGRTGALRWQLLKPFLPDHDVQTGRLKASKWTGKPTQAPRAPLPRRQQSPVISPSLRSLLLSETALKGSKPQTSHLDLPPKLVVALKKKSGLYPSEHEAVAMLQGAERNLQAVGITRRREANARWRWLTSHIERLQPPIESERSGDHLHHSALDDPGRQVGVIEAKILDRHPSIPIRIRRDLEIQEGAQALLLSSDSEGRHGPPGRSPPYLSSARQLAAEIGRGDEDCAYTQEKSEHLAKTTRKKFLWKEPTQAEINRTLPSYNLVHHGGWSRSGFIDYERDHRARRRVWQRLLEKIPKVVYPSLSPAHVQAGTEADQFRAAEVAAGKTNAEDISKGVEASFVDLALPDLEDDGSRGQEVAARPTLMARSTRYKLVPAREWRFWTDYGQTLKDTSQRQEEEKKKKGRTSTRLEESEYARANPSGPRQARPDTARWTRPDELAFLD